MKQIIQSALIPFTIFTAGLILLGCDQAREPQNPEQEKTEISVPSESNTSEQASTEPSNKVSSDLSQGNPLTIVRDVADFQLKAGDYIQQLQNTQNDVQQALNDKNLAALDSSIQHLKTQLTDFNQVLDNLNLKSEEVEKIRQKIEQANTQILASDLLNGKVDLSQVNVVKVEQQMTNIQAEMLKLASLLLPTNTDTNEKN